VASIRLPEGLRKSLLQIAAASDEAVDELYRRLSDLDKELEAEMIPDRAAENLSLWVKGDAKSVVTALVGLCSFRSQASKAVDEILNDVLSNLKKPPEEGQSEELVLKPEAELKLRERLQRFLTLESFLVTAKALGVLTDHQRAFLSCRVLSDIRPVFTDDARRGPAAAVIVHSLRIEYYENDERKYSYFALDTKDLQTLLEVLNRAQLKC
jgi:hypothetical protein